VPKLPVVSGEELAKFLIKSKNYSIRSRKGSHASLVHPYLPPVTIPLHKELKRGLLKHILRVTDTEESEIR